MGWELAETHATPPEVTPEQLITSLMRAATKNCHLCILPHISQHQRNAQIQHLPPRGSLQPGAEIKCSLIIKGLATHLTLLARHPYFLQFISLSCHFAFYKVIIISYSLLLQLNSIQCRENCEEVNH